MVAVLQKSFMEMSPEKIAGFGFLRFAIMQKMERQH
jgi:hypothetical protein